MSIGGEHNILGCLTGSRIIAAATIRNGQIQVANHAFASLFGLSEPLTDVALRDLISDSHGEDLGACLAAAEHAPTSYLGTGKRPDSTNFPLEVALECLQFAGERMTIAFAWDITQRFHATRELSSLAYSDTLTGVANRARFAGLLSNALSLWQLSGPVAVLMLDLDGFKSINDQHGHAAGDTVLQMVAQRLKACVRSSDTVARLGGDEFAIILPGLATEDFAAMVALRVLSALRTPFDLEGHELSIGASVGIAVCPKHAVTVPALLMAADAALYRAKREGRMRFAWAAGQAGPGATPGEFATWSAAHSIGIAAIDEQHVHLAGLIDNLAAMLRANEPLEKIASELGAIVSYAKFHFAAEEQIMAEAAFEGLNAHRGEHRHLIEDIEQLDLPANRAAIGPALAYLREWLLRHIDGSDRPMGIALIAKGYR